MMKSRIPPQTRTVGIRRDAQGRFLRGAAHPSWSGGIRHDRRSGYVYEKCPAHPRANAKGYVPQHVLVAEASLLGRRLEAGEVVHHKNGVKDDNRPENLQVLAISEHSSLHGKEGNALRFAIHGLRDCELLESLLRFKAVAGRYPTLREMNNPDSGVFSVTPYYRRWGSLVAARRAADDLRGD